MVIKSPAYFEMEKYIEMVCGKLSNFCVIHSEGGLGKTYSSQVILKGKNIDYAYLNSFTSPLELYNFLYDNAEGKVILIDDTEGIWDNKSIISILKNATELSGNRVISWNSTTSKLEGRNNTCPFNSGIILLTNQLPNAEKNPHIQALLSRSFLAKLNFTYEEKLDIIKEVSKTEYKDLKEEQRKEVFDFIKENTSPATRNLSIRTLIKMYHFYLFDKTNWKELAGSMLFKGISEKRKLVYELVRSGKTIKQQIAEYTQDSGFSRMDYFRIKKELFKTSSYARVKVTKSQENGKTKKTIQ